MITANAEKLKIYYRITDRIQKSKLLVTELPRK